jgi:hypothetical protein
MGGHTDANGTYRANGKNSIIETDDDLNKGGRDRQKFLKLSGPSDDAPADVVKVKDSITESKAETGDEFSDMTVQQLRKYANDNEIDLQGAFRKDEILSTLRS